MTEADLEGRIHETLKRVFPHLTNGEISHQRTFSVRLGKTVHRPANDISSGRCDLLVEKDGEPLAILELKRPDLTLSSEDVNQGLSYARLLTPKQAPLVIITNGHDTRILTSYNGKQLDDQALDSETLKIALSNAAALAATDVSAAISTLLGSDSAILKSGVEDTNALSFADTEHSLIRDGSKASRVFTLPRTLALEVIQKLQGEASVVAVQASPNSGKTNLLFQVCCQAAQEGNAAILYNASGRGSGFLRTIATALKKSIGWNATADDVRLWLQTIASSKSCQLVIAIDGLRPDHSDEIKELEDLLASADGTGLKFVVTYDEPFREGLLKKPDGRQSSVLGLRATISTLPDYLDDTEFELARSLLENCGIALMPGAAKSSDMRIPWVISSIVKSIISEGANSEPGKLVAIPPFPGISLFEAVHKQYVESTRLTLAYRKLAACYLNSLEHPDGDPGLLIEMAHKFLLPEERVTEILDRGETEWLTNQGYLTLSKHSSGRFVLSVKLPELLSASIGEELAARCLKLGAQSSASAEAQLIRPCERMPMGDTICAVAIVRVLERNANLGVKIIRELLELQPTAQEISPGLEIVGYEVDAGLIHVTVNSDGSQTVSVGGVEETFPFDEAEMPVMMSNVLPWLTLSHVASQRMEIEDSEETRRLDYMLFWELGHSQTLLRKPIGNIDHDAICVHEIQGVGSLSCRNEGICEPLVQHMMRAFHFEQHAIEPWIADVAESNSIPLLNRVDLALSMVVNAADQDAARWARNWRDDKVAPLLKQLLEAELGQSS